MQLRYLHLRPAQFAAHVGSRSAPATIAPACAYARYTHRLSNARTTLTQIWADTGPAERGGRATEFRRFLVAINKAVPAELDVPLGCDKLGTHRTPAIRDRLARHPRFHLHVTLTSSSWVNQVERWFGLFTDQLIRRGVHASSSPWRTKYVAKISAAGH